MSMTYRNSSNHAHFYFNEENKQKASSVVLQIQSC